jgi:SagB-type dehydrogenase family enzyme
MHNTPEPKEHPMSDSAGFALWRASQFDAMDKPPHERGIPAPALEWPLPPGQALVALPAPHLARAPEAIQSLLAQRRTHRAYAPDPLSQEDLSFLLWSTQGVQKHTPGERTLRTVPSAGARHAFETLLLVNNVAGLAPALYRYVATQHALTLFANAEQTMDDLRDGFRNMNLVTLSAVVFIWVCVLERMTWRFGERGWRYVLLDAGHVCQNLYLAAEACGCGACAIGAFNDADINTALGLDGATQFVIYAASAGRKPC